MSETFAKPAKIGLLHCLYRWTAEFLVSYCRLVVSGTPQLPQDPSQHLVSCLPPAV